MNLTAATVRPWNKLQVMAKYVDLDEIFGWYGVEMSKYELAMTILEVCEAYDLDTNDIFDDIESALVDLEDGDEDEEDEEDEEDTDDYLGYDDEDYEDFDEEGDDD